jgi:NADH:ubiquinone oxidoreductase subunit K
MLNLLQKLFFQYNYNFDHYIESYYKNFNFNFYRAYDTMQIYSNIALQAFYKSEIVFHGFDLKQMGYNYDLLFINKIFIEIFFKNTFSFNTLSLLPKNFKASFCYLIEKSKQNLFFKVLNYGIPYQPFFYVTYDWLHCLILCLGFFSLGILNLFKNHKDILRLLISLEVLFLSITLIFTLLSVNSFDVKGYLIAMFLLTAAACESVIGLSLTINLFRKLKTALWYFLLKLRR